MTLAQVPGFHTEVTISNFDHIPYIHLHPQDAGTPLRQSPPASGAPTTPPNSPSPTPPPNLPPTPPPTYHPTSPATVPPTPSSTPLCGEKKESYNYNTVESFDYVPVLFEEIKHLGFNSMHKRVRCVENICHMAEHKYY